MIFIPYKKSTKTLVQKKNIYTTGKNILTTLKQKKIKYHVIHSAAQLFGLNYIEEELLANKAGLSMQLDSQFPTLFSNILKKTPSYKLLYEQAQISERMFHHFKSNRIPTKQSLLALVITLGMSLEEINTLLPKAGYFLSDSLIYDKIIKHLLTTPQITKTPTKSVYLINNILYELELPLLMTRQKL